MEDYEERREGKGRYVASSLEGGESRNLIEDKAELAKVCKKGFVATFKNFEDWIKKVKL